MEGARFDALTRRLLIASAAGGVIAPLFGSDVVAAKKCRKGSKPCGGRSCPRGQRCENNICVRACADPATCCDPGSRFPACGGFLPNPCACGTTPSGGSVCFQPAPLLTPCSALTPCDAATPCSSGQVCATACCSTAAQFRCFDPCAGPFP